MTDTLFFWYIDRDDIVRMGKVMAYEVNGHRNKYFNPLSIPKELSKRRLLPQKYVLKKCLFGEHLLRQSVNDGKTVAIVESEKTAIICSLYFPDMLWMATGSSCNLQEDRLVSVKGRNLILYPDTDKEAESFMQWKLKAQDLNSLGWHVQVSQYLEKTATDEQRIQKIDIADLLIDELLANNPSVVNN